MGGKNSVRMKEENSPSLKKNYETFDLVNDDKASSKKKMKKKKKGHRILKDVWSWS